MLIQDQVTVFQWLLYIKYGGLSLTLRIKHVSQTQLCDICNNTILHLKGYLFRL
jgi:hypothetical protein